MKKIFISAFAASMLLFTYSCDTDFETDVNSIAVSSGEADFSKYVALGNSLTAGYRDNALYVDGQIESYPNMLATQMKLAGGGDFKQPLMADNLGGIPSVGVGNKLVLAVNANGVMGPVVASGNGTTTLQNIYSSGPYQNMGVPGAKSFHLLAPGYGSAANLAQGTANPYFVRFSSSANTTVIADAMAQSPTFFSLWIGNNDVLGYATSGGDGSNPITSEALFTQAYNGLVNTLTSGGAKGVVANLPNVTAIPFFTTVPYNPVPLDAASVTALNQQVFGPLKQILTAYGQGARLQLLGTANNPLLLKDEGLTDLSVQITTALIGGGVPAQQAGLMGMVFGQARHATSADLIPLTTRSAIGAKPSSQMAVAPFDKFGVTFPLEDKHVLSAAEKTEVLNATAKFNAVIRAAATSKGLAFVDANAKMLELAKSSGIQFDGVKYTTTFVTGGTFSLDGVHLTGRGYAVIANEFIKAINAKYKSSLPQVNVNSYSGITFP
ncbi:SGNH/GDSL hydrolase family protein [Planobacterium oryzisoli]|uniref:G-D-S-L family lipolytic protein n=1 Tax=Planobacterium oryzisoli TaxID=2771435 RepID=A0A931EC08_9FLAO|nr:SGNH/GDSL hydrolase family protein [Planobacterium oryzisoli]MBF5027564.1 G-D-S-L family lipolytic protein [Planobacterium oryzisoli]